MKKFQKGFTLVELLIAASIVAILAMFSTVAYRNSVWETRLEGGKAKANMLAGSYMRFMVENPGWYIQKSQMSDTIGSDEAVCRLSRDGASGELAAPLLISCGYVERQGWGSDPYFEYWVYQADITNTTDEDTVCLKAVGKKVPAKHKNKTYCIKESGAVTNGFN